MNAIYKQGAKAYRKGVHISENPYNEDPDINKYKSWVDGWSSGYYIECCAEIGWTRKGK